MITPNQQLGDKRRSNTSAILNPSALYSAEAEKAVLGCMLAQPAEVIEEASRTLVAEDFFVPAHLEIFDAMMGMEKNRVPIDAISLHQWLTDRKLADVVGSPGILAEIYTGFATHLNVGSYFKIVKEKSLLRSLQSACSAIVQDIADQPDSVPDVLSRAESAIHRVTNLGFTGSSILNAEQCVTHFEFVRGRIQRGEAETRVLTGLRALDEGNGGLPIPSYVVLAGEQGAGKSALMINLMKNIALMNRGVGAFSMEMTVEQIINRLVADIAGIDSRRLNGKLHPLEEQDVQRATDKIRKLPFHVDPTAGLRPQDLRSGVRRMVKLGCRVIWLDNAQLMAGSNEKDKRVEQLTEVSRTIQHLQKEHGITFILVAQVTRDGQKRGNLRAFDLADCAAFERDARVVIMMERKAGCENAPAVAVPTMIKIVKYSEGETGELEASFNKKEQRIQ